MLFVAGVVLMDWIVGEILILTADLEVISATGAIHLLVGAAIFGLGYRLGRRRPARRRLVNDDMSRPRPDCESAS
jgi:hypothetical protein